MDRILTMDIVAAAAVMVLLPLLDPFAVVLSAHLLLYPYLHFTGRKRLIRMVLIGTAFALVWVAIAGDIYQYAFTSPMIGTFNTFAFLAWSLGLAYLGVIMTHAEKRWRLPFRMRLLLFTLPYWLLLMTLETIAYHVWGYQNLPTGSYPGLPVCDCIHAPRWMQAVYLSMGPVFYTAWSYARKNLTGRRGRTAAG
ncbi:hypothetical protein JXB02_01495 [Candidatus Woesearchaeota archaeon]|nr:hypothetical protein [Candidatus Woesearchaeota archaeon]